MNYLFLSDILWYTGHMMSGISTFFTHTNFYLAA